MEIYELTADRVRGVAELTGADFELVKQLWEEADDRSLTAFVRVAPGWLQVAYISNHVLAEHDWMDTAVRTESLWETGELGGMNHVVSRG